MRLMLTTALGLLGLLASPASAKDAVYLSLMGEPYWTNSAGEHPFDQ